jgi:hypothetical protein
LHCTHELTLQVQLQMKNYMRFVDLGIKQIAAAARVLQHSTAMQPRNEPAQACPQLANVCNEMARCSKGDVQAAQLTVDQLQPAAACQAGVGDWALAVFAQHRLTCPAGVAGAAGGVRGSLPRLCASLLLQERQVGVH